MRSTILIGGIAFVVCGALSASGAEPKNVVPTYVVEIRLSNQTMKEEDLVLKSEISAGEPRQIRDVYQRPFVVGLSNSILREPVVQIVDCGAAANVKCAETDPGIFIVDAAIEFSDVSKVARKPHPESGTILQTVRIQSATTRLMETVSLNEKLTSTLEIGDVTYDVVISVGSKGSRD